MQQIIKNFCDETNTINSTVNHIHKKQVRELKSNIKVLLAFQVAKRFNSNLAALFAVIFTLGLELSPLLLLFSGCVGTRFRDSCPGRSSLVSKQTGHWRMTLVYVGFCGDQLDDSVKKLGKYFLSLLGNFPPPTHTHTYTCVLSLNLFICPLSLFL